MTTYIDLVTLINDANTSLTTFSGAVNQFVAQLSNQSLRGTPEATQDPIDYQKAPDGTITYILKQNNSNTEDGTYQGTYRLPVSNVCSVLTIVSVVSHANPASGAPAQVRAPSTDDDPNPSFVDVASVAALDGQQFNAFTVRSSIAFEVQVQVSACSSECTDNFIPTSANTAQIPATSLSNWLYFDSEGAYTNLGTPWSFGCYWSLATLQPLSGSDDGWNVSVTWTNGTLSHLFCATGIGDHNNNPPGQSQLSLSSGATQFVPADHPYLMVDWFPPDTSGALHITQVCVEAHHS